ncbi:MAG: hypothetical protein E7568_07090 [Ruminococcaceae bacterium]|nr:hypothetical protein [Oscillospiraceae bacterium]
MTDKTFDEYLAEMLKMYKNNKSTATVNAEVTVPIDAADYTGKGNIIVVVNGGNNAIPLENAKVTVLSESGEIIKEMLTDRSGKTGFIEVPTPKRSETLAPQNARQVYAFYDVKAEAENYVTDTIKQVPVFDGIVSIQEFNLVWIPASSNGGESVTENEGNPFNL